jgi:hypothetical protein
VLYTSYSLIIGVCLVTFPLAVYIRFSVVFLTALRLRRRSEAYGAACVLRALMVQPALSQPKTETANRTLLCSPHHSQCAAPPLSHVICSH